MKLSPASSGNESVTFISGYEWFILTGNFFNRPVPGRIYSGPYTTKDDAFTARRKLESVTGRNDLFIDSRPAEGGNTPVVES